VIRASHESAAATAAPASEVRRVLVVEDDRDLARLVDLHLRDLGCDVTCESDGVSALAEALTHRFDLVMLDLMLPRLGGLELCRRLRQREGYTPILILTARSGEADRVAGLEQGADDYLTKPFSVRELLARVKALFRRADAMASAPGPDPGAERPIRAGELAIDPARRKVTVAGRRVSLTVKEFDLLLQFARNPGRVYTRAQLLDLVWGYGRDSYQHTVNSHINRLRAKVEADPARPRYILTVWGMGYRFTDPEDWPT